MARTIRHGAELQAGDVGPGAAGVVIGRETGKSVLREGRLPGFVERRPGPADYGGLAIQGPHYLIEGVRFDGPLDLALRLPVVLYGVEIAPLEAVPLGLHIRPDSGPLFASHCRVRSARDARVGIGTLIRAPGSRIHRCLFDRVADGVHPNATGIRITETLIDDLSSARGDHNDGLQTGPTGRDLVVARCKIRNRHPQTSCLYLMGDRTRVQACSLAGGGWTVYGGAGGNGKGLADARGGSMTDCVFERAFYPRCGSFGAVAHWPSDPGAAAVFTNNRFDDGTPVIPGR